ncbi:MAG TPA: LysR family transcriptional regulator [Conexibacter sp.]|jgi:DNA-binding transcriptional LysR family regulator
MDELMDLELLRTFVAVAQTGSVNLAAGELHLSQASVSRHVQRLEAAIGSELFVRRDGRPLALTVSGRRILTPSVAILDDAGQQWERLRSLAEDAGRRLVVGFGPGVAIMPEVVDAVAQFRVRHPQINTQLIEHRSRAISLRELLDGKLDIAIAGLRDSDVSNELEVIPLVPLLMHVIVRDDHPLADHDVLTLADVADESFAFIDGGDGLNVFTEACARAGIVPRVAHRCEQLTTLIALLEGGDAISVFPAARRLSSGPFAERFRSIPLDVEQPRTTVCAYWSTRKPPAPAVQELIRLARQAMITPEPELIQD